VTSNPGIPERDPSTFSDKYLKQVKILKKHLYCSKCKLIKTNQRETEHCPTCNYCIEGLDHHCPWSSKCIGRNNMIAFKAFVSMTVVLIAYLFVGLMLDLSLSDTKLPNRK